MRTSKLLFQFAWFLTVAVAAIGHASGSETPSAVHPTDQSVPALIIHPATVVTTLTNVPVTLDLEVLNPGPLPYVFSVTPTIQNATFEINTGIYRFLPSLIQSGTYALTFSAANGFVNLTLNAVIIVNRQNRPPVVQVGFSDTLTVKEGESVRFSFFGIDPDGDPITYDIDPLLPNMTIDRRTGEVFFAPDFTQSSVYPVNLIVSDGHETISVRRFIVVLNVNRPPQLTLNPPQGRSVRVGETFSLLAFVSDPDHDPTSLTVTGLPPNSAFDSTTGLFSFTPALNQFREKYHITFTTDDGTDQVSSSADFDVKAPVSPLFEFNDPGNTEGWIANNQVQNSFVDEGIFQGVSVGSDPFVYRPGLSVDTFSQHELVIRLSLSNAGPVEIFFITEDGQFVGPATIQVFTPAEFVTYGVDFSPLFPDPKIIETLRIDPGFSPNTFVIDFVGFVQSAFPTRTPTPNPSSTPTPTPTFTPTRLPLPSGTVTVTPTPPGTPTPTPTWTPTVTLTPTPAAPLVIYDFDEHGAVRDHFYSLVPGGYNPAFVDVVDAGHTKLFSGNAMSITARPGEAALIISNASVATGVLPVLAKVSARTNSNLTSIALVALNAPIDGQLGYHAAGNGALPAASEGELSLFYRPPSQAIHLALQVVQPSNATETVRVLFDNLQAVPIGPVTSATVPLTPDGSFDKDLSQLVTNINLADGSVQVVRESGTNTAIQLSVLDTQHVVNMGVWAATLPEQLPGFVFAQFEGRRALGNGGTTAFVLTDGLQTLAVFENTSNFPFLGNSPKVLTLGGNFVKTDSLFTPFLVIQNSGLKILTSLLVDNLVMMSLPLQSR